MKAIGFSCATKIFGRPDIPALGIKKDSYCNMTATIKVWPVSFDTDVRQSSHLHVVCSADSSSSGCRFRTTFTVLAVPFYLYLLYRIPLRCQ